MPDSNDNVTGNRLVTVGINEQLKIAGERSVTVGRNETERATDTSVKQAGRSPTRATRAVGRLFGIGRAAKGPEPEPPR